MLLAIAQPPDGIPLLALVSLVPWLAGVRACGALEALVLGAVSGTLYGSLVAAWIPEALRELGSSAPTSVFGWLISGAWAWAWPFAGLALLVNATTRLPGPATIAICAAGLALGDWVASNARWGVPWALLGHSQLDATGVAQLAAVGGVPLVSALVLGVNLALALRHTVAAAALLTAWGALALGGLPLAEMLRPAPEGPARELVIVQPDLPRGERWEPRAQAANLERVAGFLRRSNVEELQGADAVLLPENLVTSPLDAHPALERRLLGWVDEIGVPVVTGLAMQASDGDPDLYRSAVAWIEPGRGITARIDKVRGVPVLESGRELAGERLLGPLFGRAAAWSKVEEAPRSESGPLRGAFTVSPVLCYEALFPGIVAERRSPDSVAILNLADDSWVVGDAATHQLTAFASFRAIEQRLPLIRVAHGGLSTVVDEYGRRTRSLPLDAYAIARIRTRPHAPPSALEKAGLLALPLGAALGVGWAAAFVTRSRP